MSDILNNVFLVFPKVSYWTGKAGAKDGEFDTSSLPSIVTLGMKQIFDQSEINKIAKFRKAVERLGLEYGTKFEGGYMIPKELKEQYFEGYKKLETKFEETKNDFLRDFDNKVEIYIAAHPADEALIRSSLPERNYVKASIKMTSRCYNVKLEDGKIDEAEAVETIFGETAKVCKSIVEDCFFNRTTPLKGKALKRRFDSSLQKLKSFAFVDSSIGTVVSKVEEYFNAINEDVLTDNERNMGQTLFTLLSDHRAIEQIAQQVWVPTIEVVEPSNKPQKPVQTLTQAAYF